MVTVSFAMRPDRGSEALAEPHVAFILTGARHEGTGVLDWIDLRHCGDPFATDEH